MKNAICMILMFIAFILAIPSLLISLIVYWIAAGDYQELQPNNKADTEH